MADGEDRTGDLRECAGDVGGVEGDAPQRVHQGLDLDAGGQQQFGDAGEAPGVGECAVDQCDGGRCCVVLGHVSVLLGAGGLGGNCRVGIDGAC